MDLKMEFEIVDQLLGLTLLGAEWVLWLLIFLSILSVAIMIERAHFYYQSRSNFTALMETLQKLLLGHKYKRGMELCKDDPSLEAQVTYLGLKHRHLDKSDLEGQLESHLIQQKNIYDKGLIILGTLGNNAPFIGLFGTVIGIIKAFNDLSLNPEGGPSVVMSGISEALVATAVGLLVAIPAVISFNYFNRLVKNRMGNCQAIIKLLTSHKFEENKNKVSKASQGEAS